MNESEKIRAIRNATGEGLLSAKKALEACDGDPILACGFTEVVGQPVYYKGSDRKKWFDERVKAASKKYSMINGKIEKKDPDSSIEPG